MAYNQFLKKKVFRNKYYIFFAGPGLAKWSNALRRYSYFRDVIGCGPMIKATTRLYILGGDGWERRSASLTESSLAMPGARQICAALGEMACFL